MTSADLVDPTLAVWLALGQAPNRPDSEEFSLPEETVKKPLGVVWELKQG